MRTLFLPTLRLSELVNIPGGFRTTVFGKVFIVALAVFASFVPIRSQGDEPASGSSTPPIGGATHETRVWTSTAGSKLEAKYVSGDELFVTLERRDGTRLRVALAGLVETDRAYAAQIRVRDKPVSLISPWRGLPFGNGINTQQFLRMADSVPVKINIIPCELPVGAQLEHQIADFLKVHEHHPSDRVLLLVTHLETASKGIEHRSLTKATNDMLAQARKLDARVLVWETPDLSGAMPYLEPGAKNNEERTLTPDEFAASRDRWIKGLEKCEVVPINEVLVALRARNPVWKKSLRNGRVPGYLAEACLLSTLTRTPPPLVKVRNELAEQRGVPANAEEYTDIVDLPVAEAEAVSIMIHETVTRRNTRRRPSIR